MPGGGARRIVRPMLPTHTPVVPVSDPQLPPLDEARDASSVRRVLQRLKWTLYGVACIVYLFPPMDMLSSVLPLHFRDIQWRFQFTTLFGQSMLTQTMALTGATVLATIVRHERGQALVRLLCFTEAILIVPMIGIFVADYLQIRPALEEDLRGRLRIVMYKTCFELAVGALLMAWLWWQLDRPVVKKADEPKRKKRRRRVVPNYEDPVAPA